MIKKIAIAAALMVLVLAAWVYSWTRTPHGPLRLGPAVIVRLMAIQGGGGGVVSFTPESRAAANRITARFAFLGEVPDDIAIQDAAIERPDHRIPLRIYTPGQAGGSGPLPIVLNIHGGGWWMGNGFIDEPIAAEFASLAPAVVVSVDYRLAPEHPYPAPLDDCWQALLWVRDNARRLGADPNRIAVMGGSAGGNLSAGLAIRARDAGGPAIGFQFLIVPSLDLRDESLTPGTGSLVDFAEGYTLTTAGIRQMAAAYVPEPSQRGLATVSPLAVGSVAGLPPAFIATAGFDPLRDGGEAYAVRLREGGVDAVAKRYEGVLHGFMGTPDVMSQANRDGAAMLRRVFGMAPADR